MDTFKKSAKCQELSTKIREMGNKVYTGKGHNEERHRSALNLYSKSIAYAPPASEQLALGYSNRSVLLKHLKKYEEAIVDIDRALKISNSVELKVKLDKRRSECEALINEALDKVDSLKNSKLPEMIPSKAVPTFADCVSLKYDETYGRHVIANRNIEPGEIIAVEKSYVSVPLKHQLYLICYHCLEFCWNGVPCDNCVFSIYCSEKCKSEALAEYHDVECPVLPFLYESQSDTIDLTHHLVTTRLFIKSLKKEGLDNLLRDAKTVDSYKCLPLDELFENGLFNNESFKTLYSLINHKDALEGKDLLYSVMIVELLKKHTNIFNSTKLLEDPTNSTEIYDYLKKLIIKLKSIVSSNSYLFQNVACEYSNNPLYLSDCDEGLGVILAPSCGFFNHSCVPNVSRIFAPPSKIVLFTCLPVKKGKQLFVSYGPCLDLEKEKRQLFLQQNFNFSCLCKACEEDWSSDFSDSAYEKFMSEVKGYIKHENKELQKYCSRKKIDLNSVNYSEDKAYDLKSIRYHIKKILLAHENLKECNAFIRSLPSKLYIEAAFQKFYGVESNIPDEC